MSYIYTKRDLAMRDIIAITECIHPSNWRTLPPSPQDIANRGFLLDLISYDELRRIEGCMTGRPTVQRVMPRIYA